MITSDEFDKLTEKQIRILTDKHGIFMPPLMPLDNLKDLAKSKLHGIEFLNYDEEIIKGKIKQREMPKIPYTPAKKCPNCSNFKLTVMETRPNQFHTNYQSCSFCGLILPPLEPKKPAIQSQKKPEVKTS